MAVTKELKVRIDTAVNADASTGQLRELKKLLKEIPATAPEFKKVSQAIADSSDKIKVAKGQSEDWIDALASAPGPIGMLGRGLDTVTSSTNKFGLALKATGIGLIVALVGQLVAAFSENERAMKKLEPVMIMFEQILGGIFAALEPVFDILVDLAIKAMPYVQKAIGVLYSAFFALGSYLKNFFTVQIKNFQAFGKIIRGAFTFDADLIKEGLTDIVTNIKEGAKNVVNDTKKTWDRFNEGLKETTKTQKKNLEKQRENEKKAQSERDAAAKKAFEDRKNQIDQENKDREAALAKQQAIAMAGAKTEMERYNLEKQFAEDTYNAKKLSLEKTRALYPKGSKDFKDYTTQLTALETEYINKKTELANRGKEVAQKAFQEEVKTIQDENKRKVDDLTSTYNLQKELLGENAAETRKTQDEIFKVQEEALAAERRAYENKQELNAEEKARLEDIIIAQKNLTNTIIIENDKRRKADVDSFLKAKEDEKAAREEKFAQDMELAATDFALQQEILNKKVEQDKKYYEELLANENLTVEQRKKLEEEFTKVKKDNADKQKEIEEKKFKAQQDLLNASAAAVATVAEIIGKDTVAGKALAVASSLISTYTAIAGQLRAFKDVPIPGYAIAQAIATGLVGFKAVKDIVATPVPQGGGSGGGNTPAPQVRQLATGGFVSGPGTETSDSIPALLSNGESVINASSTRMFRPLLSTINQIGGGRKFAEGGIVSPTQAMDELNMALANSQSQPIKTYVVASDMTSMQMFDRAQKSRSTL